MRDTRAEQRFDNLASQLHDWTESALSLDEGHFPSELLSDLEDVVSEFKEFLEDEEGYERTEVVELFATPEMGEVMERFPRVRRLLDRAWGPQLAELLEEDANDFGTLDDD